MTVVPGIPFSNAKLTCRDQGHRMSGLFHGIVYPGRFPSFLLGQFSIKQPGIVTIVDLWHFVMVKPQHYTHQLCAKTNPREIRDSPTSRHYPFRRWLVSLSLLGNHRLDTYYRAAIYSMGPVYHGKPYGLKYGIQDYEAESKVNKGNNSGTTISAKHIYSDHGFNKD